MPLSSFSTAVTVFLTTWLSGPLIYSLDKLAAMEDERWIFVAGVIVLPCFGLMTYVFARKTQAMSESDQPLFYGKKAYCSKLREPVCKKGRKCFPVKRGSLVVSAPASGARDSMFDPACGEGNFGVRTRFPTVSFAAMTLDKWAILQIRTRYLLCRESHPGRLKNLKYSNEGVCRRHRSVYSYVFCVFSTLLGGLPIYRQQPSTTDNNRQQPTTTVNNRQQTYKYRQQVFFTK